MLWRISGISQELLHLKQEKITWKPIMMTHDIRFDIIYLLIFSLPGILDSWQRLWTHSQPPSRRLEIGLGQNTPGHRHVFGHCYTKKIDPPPRIPLMHFVDLSLRSYSLCVAQCHNFGKCMKVIVKLGRTNTMTNTDKDKKVENKWIIDCSAILRLYSNLIVF